VLLAVRFVRQFGAVRISARVLRFVWHSLALLLIIIIAFRLTNGLLGTTVCLLFVNHLSTYPLYCLTQRAILPIAVPIRLYTACLLMCSLLAIVSAGTPSKKRICIIRRLGSSKAFMYISIPSRTDFNFPPSSEIEEDALHKCHVRSISFISFVVKFIQHLL